MSEVGNILAQAIKVMDEKGWCTGILRNHHGNVCAVGAINSVMYQDAVGYAKTIQDTVTQGRVCEALNKHIPGSKVPDDPLVNPCGNIVSYNNTRNSYQEVRDWFEKAAMDEGVAL